MTTLFAVLGWLLGIGALCGAGLAVVVGYNARDLAVIAMAAGSAIACIGFAVVVNPLARRVNWLEALWVRSVLAAILFPASVGLFFLAISSTWSASRVRPAPAWAVNEDQSGLSLGLSGFDGFKLLCPANAQNYLMFIQSGALATVVEAARQEGMRSPGETSQLFIGDGVQEFAFTATATARGADRFSDGDVVEIPATHSLIAGIKTQSTITFHAPDHSPLQFSASTAEDRRTLQTFFQRCEGRS